MFFLHIYFWKFQRQVLPNLKFKLLRVKPGAFLIDIWQAWECKRKSPSIESILWMAKWQSNELVLVRPSLWNVFVSTVSTIWCPGGWLLIRQQVGGESVYLECVRCPPFGVLVSGSPAVAAPNHQHHLCWPKQALDTPLVSMVCPSNGQTVFSRHTATGHWTLDTGHTMFSGPLCLHFASLQL